MKNIENNHRINKIMKPVLPEVVKRERLFDLLDQQEPYGVTWITGPAGSGKSTLIADYLQKRDKPHLWYRLDDGDNDLFSFFHYLSQALGNIGTRKKNVPVPFLTTEYKTRVIEFSKRFFDYLAQSLKSPFIVVFDNYYAESFESIFQDVFREGVLRLIPGIQVILISREAPSNGFAGLIASNRLRVVGNQDLAFTEQETEALIQNETGETFSQEITRQIFETTKGWAAGLRLILIGITGHKGLPDSIAEITLDNIFDYFDSELFQLLSPQTRSMLVKSALWPRMPLTILTSFMSPIDIGSLLNQLAENHFFIERYGAGSGTVYQYHPLFHEFLKSRVPDYLDPKEKQAIQIQGASAFERLGWAEEALELFLQAGLYADYIRVLLKDSPTLIRQIRYQTLRKRILSLPDSVRLSNAWLNYWAGISYRFYSLAESRKYYELAFEQFKKTDDWNGTLLAWSGIVDMITYEFNRLSDLDPYLDWFKRHVKKNHCFDSRETEARVSGSLLCVLFCREPQNRDMGFWRKRALNSAACEDITVKISTYIWSIIPLLFTCPDKHIPRLRDKLNVLTENHESRLIRLANLWLRAYSFFMIDSAPAEAIEIASAGLDLAEQIQVPLYNGSFFVTGVMASLTMHDSRTADHFLKKLKDRLEPDQYYFMGLYHYLKSVRHFNTAEYESAIRHGETAAQIIQNTGHVLLRIMAVLQVRQAEFFLRPRLKCIGEVERLIHAAEKQGSPIIAHSARLTKAFMLLHLGRETKGLQELKTALTMGQKRGFIRFVWSWPYPIIEKLCAVALEHGLNPRFIRQLIRSYDLYPARPENVLKNWDWPVQIETLGGFRMRVAGRKTDSGVKTKAKPLELLELLIALGPKPVAMDKIMDYLWPDKDGDLAHASLKTTLNRLRNLLGAKELVLLNDNKIFLNYQICFVDLEMFERTIQRAYRENGPERDAWLERAVALYQGGFLAGGSEKPWITAKREEVKEKYLSAITELGIHYECGHQTERAVACYEQGLEREPGEEILYQHLMSICAKRGEKDKVVKWQQRCRTELQDRYAVKPSRAIQVIRERFG
ncbi:MAG: hypothetical protein EHM45_02955 [Desulfobacteraceae bacterium]|nr:MAG: hypothetical protein EHM45_02955 [Desulfobacteraceae bacterium]